MTHAEWILAADDDALIPARRAKAALREAHIVPPVSWIGLAHALELIPNENDRALRRKCLKFERIQFKGGTPEIRVRRKTDALRSDWLLNEDDVRKYGKGRTRQALAIVTDDPNDADAIADAIVQRHFG